jgi:hypothetical protein
VLDDVLRRLDGVLDRALIAGPAAQIVDLPPAVLVEHLQLVAPLQRREEVVRRRGRWRSQLLVEVPLGQQRHLRTLLMKGLRPGEGETVGCIAVDRRSAKGVRARLWSVLELCVAIVVRCLLLAQAY